MKSAQVLTKSVLVLTVTLFTGCATTARLNPACELTGGAGGYLISVEQGESLTHLLLYRQQSAPGQLVAINPVGARLFEGNVSNGSFAVSATPFYRGPEPALVLWAFALWRMREQAQGCWVVDGTHLAPATDGGMTLLRRQKALAVWSPATPQTLTLPAKGMTFKFQETE